MWSCLAHGSNERPLYIGMPEYTGLPTGDRKDWLPQFVCMRLERCVKELILIYLEDKNYFKSKHYVEADINRPKIQTCLFF